MGHCGQWPIMVLRDFSLLCQENDSRVIALSSQREMGQCSAMAIRNIFSHEKLRSLLHQGNERLWSMFQHDNERAHGQYFIVIRNCDSAQPYPGQWSLLLHTNWSMFYHDNESLWSLFLHDNERDHGQ